MYTRRVPITPIVPIIPIIPMLCKALTRFASAESADSVRQPRLRPISPRTLQHLITYHSSRPSAIPNSFVMASSMRQLPLRLCRFSTPARRFSSINRCSQSAASDTNGAAETPTEPLPSRWLPDLKSRIKKIQDASPSKAGRADALSQDLDSRWLDLIAGSEGFLTQPEWRGLDRREIIWGDIVRGHCQLFILLSRVHWLTFGCLAFVASG